VATAVVKLFLQPSSKNFTEYAATKCLARLGWFCQAFFGVYDQFAPICGNLEQIGANWGKLDILFSI